MSEELTETKAPTDILELFNRDPQELTKPNIDEMINVFRNSRHLFNSGNVKAGATKAKPKTAKQKVIEGLAAKIDLTDIKL